MNRTRMSFTYLIGYLSFGGIGMVVAPGFATRLLGSNGTYPDALLRFLGGFMIALAIIVIQIYRQDVKVMYPTALAARVPLIATIISAYAATQDPMFLTLTAMVGFGMALTATGLVMDRK